MTCLTPKQAGSSQLALNIARRILRQPAMDTIREDMEDLCEGNSDVFCGHLAREIDIELNKG